MQLVGFQEEVQLREQDWGNFQVRKATACHTTAAQICFGQLAAAQPGISRRLPSQAC